MEALKKFVEHFGDYGKEVMALGNLGNKVCTCMFAGIAEITMFAPINFIISKEEDYLYFVFAIAWATLAVNFHINNYVVQTEEGKRVTVYQKLAYVPIDRKTIQKMLLKRLLRYIGITTIITVMIQGMMTLFVCPSSIWQNLLYAVGMIGVTPFIAGLLLIYIRR